MRIVIISAVAPPEPLCAGRIHWDMAEYMASQNNEVYLVSPYPSRPLGTPYVKENFNKETYIRKNFVHVQVNSYMHPEYSLFCRAFESLDFGIRSIRHVNKNITDYDIIYVSPWALIGHLMILLLRKNKKAAFVMNVQDLYPESLFVKINSRPIKKLLKPLRLIDRYIAHNSTHITVVSESLKNIYLHKRKTTESKITVLHNWQDESEFLKPVISKDQILMKYRLGGLKNKFVFMFLGNIGPVADVETIINAFGGLPNDNCAMVIAGSGTNKERCRLIGEKISISNIFFVDVPVGLNHVVELQAISDILMLPILPNAANSSIPSKLIAYMFSSKPVITSANIYSETAIVIIKSKCGWVTKSHNVTEWLKAMKTAFETGKGRLNEMGRSGFEYAIQNHSKKEGLIKVNQLFHKLINN